MKQRLHALVGACLCACFALSSFAQEKIWFTSSSLAYCNTDGSGITASTDFRDTSGDSDPYYGRDAGFIMQASTGDIYVVTTSGGLDDFGTLVRVTRNGLKKIEDLGYAMQNAFMTEGKDGYIYGVQSGALYPHIFRFRLDGSDLKRTDVTAYGMRESELTTSLMGEILGTSQYHLYKFKPDMSGITRLYTYRRETGNSPIGKLHQSADGYLYGVTRLGGAKNYGVVYRVRATGQEYQVLHEFDQTNGRYPDRGLTEDTSGNLYGVTNSGGLFQRGVLFKIRKDGSAFEILHHFSMSDHPDYYEPNPDPPNILQIDKDGNLYGEPPDHYNRAMFKFAIATKTYSTPIIGNMTISDIHLFREISPSVQVMRPANGATNVPVSDTYRVTPIVGSLSYTIEFSTAPDFSEGVLTSTSTSPSNMPRVNLAYSTRYYARPKSSLWPYYGKTISFTTGTPENFAFVKSPKDGSMNVAAPNLNITANQVPGAKRYTIELSTSSNFATNVMTRVSSVDNQRTLKFSGLAYSTLYYSRVKTDISGYGKITNFTTEADPASATVFRQPDAVMLDVHPNPSSTFFNITLNSSSAIQAQVVMTKINGEVVENYIMRAGEVRHVGSNIERGIYIVKIFTTSGIQVRRIVKE